MAPLGLFVFVCRLCQVKKNGHLTCTETASFVPVMVKTSTTILNLLKFAHLATSTLYFQLLATSDPSEFLCLVQTDASLDCDCCCVPSNVTSNTVEGP